MKNSRIFQVRCFLVDQGVGQLEREDGRFTFVTPNGLQGSITVQDDDSMVETIGGETQTFKTIKELRQAWR